MCSSSAMKPMLPRLMPSTGMPLALASWAAWRMVPSPPKHVKMSASDSSASKLPKATLEGSSSRPPCSTSKGRQMAVDAPAFSKMRWAAWAARSPRSRKGLGLSTIFMLPSPLQRLVGPVHQFL